MENRLRDRLNHLVSSGKILISKFLSKKINKFVFKDEAPDTGDDSDEDLVTNYLANSNSNPGNNDALVPTIHITPQSPNGNHVLGKQPFF